MSALVLIVSSSPFLSCATTSVVDFSRLLQLRHVCAFPLPTLALAPRSIYMLPQLSGSTCPKPSNEHARRDLYMNGCLGGGFTPIGRSAFSRSGGFPISQQPLSFFTSTRASRWCTLSSPPRPGDTVVYRPFPAALASSPWVFYGPPRSSSNRSPLLMGHILFSCASVDDLRVIF